MTRTAYIAGKISGLPKSHVQDKFNFVNNQLRELGYEVITPTGVSEEPSVWEEAVREDIKRMLQCDEVHMLPDWKDSRGAQLERDIALRLGMQVVYH